MVSIHWWPSLILIYFLALSNWSDTLYLGEKLDLPWYSPVSSLTNFIENDSIIHRNVNMNGFIEFITGDASKTFKDWILHGSPNDHCSISPKYLSDGIRSKPLSDLFAFGMTHLCWRKTNSESNTEWEERAFTDRSDGSNRTNDVCQWTYSEFPNRFDRSCSIAIGNLKNPSIDRRDHWFSLSLSSLTSSGW